MSLSSAVLPFASLGQLFPDMALSDEQSAIRVRRLETDSRKLQSGDLFIACPGLRVDPRCFIGEALEKGVAAIVYEKQGSEAFSGLDEVDHPALLAIENLGQQVSTIASRFYAHPSTALKVAGITGTNGKTSCCFWLSALLQELGCRVGQIGTLGARVNHESLPGAGIGMTTPGPVEVQALLSGFVEHACSHAVMEVSSHALDQGRVNGVHFELAVLTNLSRDHLDYHGDESRYRAAKEILFSSFSLRAAILNLDDAFAQTLLQKGVNAEEVFSYSLRDAAADFYLSDIAFHTGGCTAMLHAGHFCSPVTLPVMGEFNLSNVLAVVAAAVVLGFDAEKIVACLPRLPSPPGRMQTVAKAADVQVVVDYAHTPDALEKALLALRRHIASGELVCVFGCGGDRDRGKRPMMGDIASRLADRVYLTADNPRSEQVEQIIADIQRGCQGAAQVRVMPDRREAIETAIGQAAKGDVVLLAGKGHEQFQEIAGSKLPFDDCEVAQAALLKRGEAA